MGGCSNIRVWMGLVALVVVVSLGSSEATTCAEVMDQQMQECLSYLEGSRGTDEVPMGPGACCGAVSMTMSPLDQQDVCTCLKNQLMSSQSPVIDFRVEIVIEACQPQSPYAYDFFTNIFRTQPSDIDCSSLPFSAAA